MDGLRRADDVGLDLVEISPNTNPPVCKILDYGKYIYEKQKLDKKNRKKQHVIHVKEIRIRPNTGEFFTTSAILTVNSPFFFMNSFVLCSVI